MQLTADQQRVVQTRNKDMLVSAAAGSGKTAVLVQRILEKITDEEKPVDIDRMLIVTFTNAAAAEMRERIHREICDKLEKNQGNQNLQKQAALIHNAQITTIDSFCLFLLKNHFQEIGLDPGFRIADPGEMKLLEQEILVDVLEEFYQNKDQAFLDFCDAYSPDGKDGKIEELILKLYRLSMSNPWPMEWLSKCEENCLNVREDMLWNSEWMRLLWEMTSHRILDVIGYLGQAMEICKQPGGPYMYTSLLETEKEEITSAVPILEKPLTKDSFMEFAAWIGSLSWGRLPSKKDESVEEQKREQVKGIRKKYKDLITDLQVDYYTDSIETILYKETIAKQQNLVLIQMTQRYIEMLAKAKRKQNLIDFSDAEHMALEILYKDGKPSQTAQAYRDYFEEVMIDEYQDSNYVQEILLSSIAKDQDGTHNRFMVGDMKQSIYKFRLARPEIFMDKYELYKQENPNNILINLKKNFRSRQEVLDSTNDVFRVIMRPQVGGIDYDADAMLYRGATFPGISEKEEKEYAIESKEGVYRSEILLLEKGDLKQATYRQEEAKLIAKKIHDIVGKMPVSEGENGFRPARYKDIVILTRSEKGIATVLRSQLLAAGIPVHVTSKEGYFSATEISMLMDFLKVLENPYDDIALCSSLKSMFFSFTDDMLALIKTGSSADRFWDCLKECSKQQTELGELVAGTIATIGYYRDRAVYLNMTQLVNCILQDFHYLEYVTAMPAGEQRKANVEMFVEKTVDFENTSMHGLFSFISYMQQLKKYQVEMGEASTLSESADVVRIMTIHKSKGLEFPICIVACMDKAFNNGDLKQAVLLDVEYGIASDYVDIDKRVKGKTLKKKVLQKKIKREAIGEELRVLYVAMTRAKEKLILTGCVSDVEKWTAEYAQMMEGKKTALITDLENCKSMLDAVGMAAATEGKNFVLTRVSMEDLQKSFDLQDNKKVDKRVALSELGTDQITLSKEQESLLQQLKQKFDYTYLHDNLKGLHTKTSVSELKKAAMEEADLHPAFETEDKTKPILPAFMKEKEALGGTAFGSAMHRALELIDFEKYADIEKKDMKECIICDLRDFTAQGKISEEYVGLVSVDKVVGFLQSDIAKRMMQAAKSGTLYKEQPFVLSLSANRVDARFPNEEIVLIQGIIDVFFEEDGQYVILDYKTDRIENMQALRDRYETQLNYYEEAVQRITGKNVMEKVLYSFALAEELSWK